MLFQGQEFGPSSPFLYFADHKPELAEAVAKGRTEFLEQFPSLAGERFASPDAVETFEQCKLDHRERQKNADIVALHRDLIRLRREMTGTVRGAVIGERAFVLRYEERLLIVNLGDELRLDVIDEPLLAPPREHDWELRWTSSDTPAIEIKETWRIPAAIAIVLG